MVIVETVLTGLVDEFPKLGLNTCVRILTATTVAILFMLIGLPMTTQVYLYIVYGAPRHLTLGGEQLTNINAPLYAHY